MKYEWNLRRILVDQWKEFYIDYGLLKRLIKKATTEGSTPADVYEFRRVMVREEERVGKFVADVYEGLARDIASLKAGEVRYRTLDAEEIAVRLLLFERFASQNKEGVRKLLKKFAKWMRLTLPLPWFSMDDSPLTVALSNVHPLIVAYSAACSPHRFPMSNVDWAPPDSFQRTTVKYWIRPEHGTAVKLFVLRHLPLLEVVKSPTPPPVLSRASQAHNYLSSVYFDSEEGNCYMRRMALEEGAVLLRFRFYGGAPNLVDGLPRPKGPETVFFAELKTHHDVTQSGLKSTKERFPIRGRMIGDFVTCRRPAADIVREMVTLGHIIEGSAEAQTEIAEYIQECVRTLSLIPRIRTVYHRTAFQRNDSNEVRVSFDLPMHLVKEDASLMGSDGHDWLSLFKQTFNPEMTKEFPFGVLEVKTEKEDPPAWVLELIETGWLMRIEKFSKFQQATSQFFPEVCTSRPYWLDLLANKTHSSKIVSADEIAGLYAANVFTKQHVVDDHDNDDGDDSDDSSDDGERRGLLFSQSGPSSGAEGRSRESSGSSGNGNGNVRFGQNGLAAPTSPTGDGVRRSLILGDLLRSALGASPPASQASPQSVNQRRTYCSVAPPVEQPTEVVTVEVHPKVFFANERVFLRWMFCSVLFIAMALLLITLDRDFQSTAVVLFGIGVLFIVYGAVLHRWRVTRITKYDEFLRVDDRVGPYLWAALLFTASIMMYVNMRNGETMPSYTCQRIDPNCAPLTPLPSVTTVRLMGAGGGPYLISDLLSRAAVCLPAIGKSQQRMTVTAYEDDETMYCFPTLDACANLFARFSTASMAFEVAVRNGTSFARTFLSVFNLPSNGTTTMYDGQYNNAGLYGVKRFPTTVAPATIEAINALANVSVFPIATPMQLTPTLKFVRAFPGVQLADQTGTLKVVATFATVDDRALQRNPVTLNSEVALTSTTTAPALFSYATLRQAQSVLVSIVTNQQVPTPIKQGFHK